MAKAIHCPKCRKEITVGEKAYQVLESVVLDDGSLEVDHGVGIYCADCYNQWKK